MAINIIGNQLVKLYSGENFNQRNARLTWDTRTYCQVVREEQTTMFQLQMTPQTGDNIVTNGDFDTSLNSWNQTLGNVGDWIPDNGTARGTVTNGINTAIATSVNLDANSYYEIEFNIDSITSGGQVIVNIDPTPDYGNGQALGATSAGTYVFWFSSDSSISADIYISLFGVSNEQVYFDYVKMVKYTTPVVTVTDCEGVTKRTLTPIQANDRLNYTIDWVGLTQDTCYRVCITNIDDLDYNYLDYALALGTEGGQPLQLYEGGLLKWYG